MAHQDGGMLHKMHKRARHHTSTVVSEPASVAPANATPTSIGRAGVANTGKTGPVATAPPATHKLVTSANSAYGVSFANVVTNGTPTPVVVTPNATGTAFAAGNAGTTNASSSATSASAKPVLSKYAMWGIIGGGSAIGLALVVMLCWCCWKKRKTKRDESQWWSLDASLQSKPIAGKPVKLSDTDTWAPRDVKGYDEKPYSNGSTSHLTSPPAFADSNQPFTPYNESTDDIQRQNERTRELLLAPSASPASPRPREREQINEVFSFGNTAHSSYASTYYPGPPSRAFLPSAESAPSLYTTASDGPPARPLRPSQNFHSGDAVPEDDATLTSRAKKRQSTRSFTQLDYASSPPEPMPDLPSPISLPKRLASAARGPLSPVTPTSPVPPYSLSSSNERSDVFDSMVDSFPPPPRSPPARKDSMKSVKTGAFGRVDSKPLRELEDILDSFQHDPETPPVPDAESIRALSVSSKASGPTPPLRINPNYSGITPSYSTKSLSPFDAESHYAMNQAHSVHSHVGDIGETLAHDLDSRQPSPVKMVTPTIMRSDSRGNRHHDFRPDSDLYGLDPRSSGGSDEFGSGVVDAPQIVRKISLQRGNAPVRLTRDESLHRQRLATFSEQEDPPSLGWNNADSPASSAPQTPRDLKSDGFVPLASMTLDQGAMSYQSTTEDFLSDIYGDLPPDLQSLPKDDPRVSRHILSLYGGIAAN